MIPAAGVAQVRFPLLFCKYPVPDVDGMVPPRTPVALKYGIEEAVAVDKLAPVPPY